MSKITTVFFSPSESTKKVVSQIANNFDDEYVVCDLLYFNDEKEFASDDIVIVGMPIFAGRIPKSSQNPKRIGCRLTAIHMVFILY